MYRSPNIESTPWPRTIRNWSAASARSLVCRLWRSQEGNTPLRNCPIRLIKGSLYRYRHFIHVHQKRAVIPWPEEGPPTGSLPSSSRCDDIGQSSARLHIKREPDSRAQVDSSQARPSLPSLTLYLWVLPVWGWFYDILFVEWVMNLTNQTLSIFYRYNHDSLFNHCRFYLYFVGMSYYRILNLV